MVGTPDTMRIATETVGPAIYRGDRHVLTHNLHALEPSGFTNFIHPLMSRIGACITENAPADHRHHRGLFWAWRRVIVGDTCVDSWTGENFEHEVVESSATASESRATLTTELNWLMTASPIVRERTTIAICDDADTRRLDLEIRLRALVANVAIAGSDDEKGYGGLTLRFAASDRVRITSDGRTLEPALGPVPTGPVVEFAWAPRPERFPRRVTARCTVDDQPWTSWVLRRGPAMQNAAFPGRAPHAIPTDRDLAIRLALEIEG
jgi:hypothetical protein